MEKENTNKTLNNFVELHLDKIKVFERISIVIFALGLIPFALKQSYASYIVLVGAIVIAFCNFFYAFSVIEIENIETTGVLNSIGFINFIYKLTHFSISISAISILELFSKFKAAQMVYVAGLTLIFTLVISIITRINDRSKIYNSLYYLKIFICLLLLGYLVAKRNNLL